MPVVHFESHHTLLREFDAGPPRAVDAIIVPAGRTAAHLRSAARLADELGSVLLLMCWQGGADPTAFAAIADRELPRLVWDHLNLPEDLTHPLLPPTASPHAFSRDWRHGPLSTKRNLALLVARMVGWRTVMFLDDDIVDIDDKVVRSAASRLETATAIGLTVGSFPDNSVVCHANRLAGGGQDVFVGAPALLLDLTRPFGFFPNVYNEDWIFLYDLVAAGQVGRVNRVAQLEYKPFLDPARARAEEFGDVIAEGLMADLHDPRHSGPPIEHLYWSDFLSARLAFVRGIITELAHRSETEANQAICSLRASEDRLRSIDGEQCAHFVTAWRNDLESWHELVAGLGSHADVRGAADFLGLRRRDDVVALTA